MTASRFFEFLFWSVVVSVFGLAGWCLAMEEAERPGADAKVEARYQAEGRQAARAGVRPMANPYLHWTGFDADRLKVSWDKGWGDVHGARNRAFLAARD